MRSGCLKAFKNSGWILLEEGEGKSKKNLLKGLEKELKLRVTRPLSQTPLEVLARIQPEFLRGLSRFFSIFSSRAAGSMFSFAWQAQSLFQTSCAKKTILLVSFGAIFLIFIVFFFLSALERIASCGVSSGRGVPRRETFKRL